MKKRIFGSQIDLLIVRKDQVINICEMKYSETDFVVDAKFDRDMKIKITDLIASTRTKYAIYPTLITTYGVEENACSSELQPIITAESLFL